MMSELRGQKTYFYILMNVRECTTTRNILSRKKNYMDFPAVTKTDIFFLRSCIVLTRCCACNCLCMLMYFVP